jgi:glucose/arabinose dehydrogenase
MPDHRRIMSRPIVVFPLLFLAVLAPLTQAAQLPAGFAETVLVDNLIEPTAMAWGPSGELWITGKRGHIWLLRQGQLTPIAQLHVGSSGEQGIEGIAVDPDYATNQFIWVYYTRLNPSPARNVLSRFRHVGDQLVEEDEMIKGPPIQNDIHNGGCLRFAADGTLFVSTGEDDQAQLAQKKDNLRGKILHLNRDGTPAADNPFRNGDGNPYVWAYGFRNPWRFDIQPGTGNLFIGDVGQAQWEEIDLGVRGGNFGWPVVEGPNPSGLHGFVYPLYAYPHPSDAARGSAVTGGDHVRGNNFPPEYQGNYFFGDSTRDWIHRMVLDSSNKVVSVQDFATRMPRVVDIQFGPDGALYYVGYDAGHVRRIAYVGGTDRQPTAAAALSADNGDAPLSVTFDASASTDPDGDPLAFLWAFGDGATSTAENVTHTYPRGEYEARLTVRDGKGAEASTGGLRIVAGNHRPTAEITAPADGKLYNIGEHIHYSGKGIDPEEGTIPCAQMSWTVILHHKDHTHPFLGPIQGSCSGSFVTVQHSDSGIVYYEIRLTVSDTGGSLGAQGVLTGTQSIKIRPRGQGVTP